MEVQLQLKLATGTVAASLGYESAVDEVVKQLGLRMYPVNPGTQDSKEATRFRIPVPDQSAGERVVDALNEHEGVQIATFG
ncbi:MAG: hypothetical protein NTV40_08935 [Solirubrobacterales bacterium]|nr:hypothetical protein [Solirubrobacterales bacterium]